MDFDIGSGLRSADTTIRGSGDVVDGTCYIIDLVAPFGGSKEVIKLMQENQTNSAGTDKFEWIIPEFGYGMSKSQSYPNDEKEQNMFVNELIVDGKRNPRTIDHERGIVLKLCNDNREGFRTFTITMGENVIPFMTTCKTLPRDEQGLPPIIWNIESFLGGVFY